MGVVKGDTRSLDPKPVNPKPEITNSSMVASIH